MDKTHSALFEVNTTYWYSDGEKCAHGHLYQPLCNRCRVPVRFGVSYKGEPKVAPGDEFFVAYRSLMKSELVQTAKKSDEFRNSKLPKRAEYKFNAAVVRTAAQAARDARPPASSRSAAAAGDHRSKHAGAIGGGSTTSSEGTVHDPASSGAAPAASGLAEDEPQNGRSGDDNEVVYVCGHTGLGGGGASVAVTEPALPTG